ncbi:MAG: ATP-dependent Clp protease ATP-binding subunit, partial [Chloroflexi bacterium]|nr:ATP-dependent Clp protease ATP-binding subunit [Chloroflexota bacterium]
RYGHSQLDTEHILMALLEQESIVSSILEDLGADVEHIRHRVEEVLKAGPRLGGPGTLHPQQIYITPRVKRLMDRANEEASRLNAEAISVEHLFLAILAEQESAAARILVDAQITYERFEAVLRHRQSGRSATGQAPEMSLKTLEKYSRDLTKLAREGKLDPVIGRDREIMRV